MDLSKVIFMKQSGKILPEASLFEIFFTRKMGQESITTATGNPVSIVTNRAQNAIRTLISFNSENGVSEINLNGCGKNLCTIFTDGKVPSISTGALVTAGGARSDFVRVSPSTNYIFSVESTSQQLYLFYYDINKTYIGNNSDAGLKVTHITPSNCYYIMIRTGANVDSTEKPQLEQGSTATAYEPYTQGVNLTITLGDTYYEGTIDIENGILTADGQTVPLTPQTVALLSGANTLWTDGDSVTISYRR